MNEFKVGQWVTLKCAPCGSQVPMIIVDVFPKGNEPSCKVMWHLKDLSMTWNIIENIFLEIYED